MVERRTTLGLLAHVILVLGVLVVAFPIYLAFVASTHTAQEIVQAPMPMLPGPHFFENHGDLRTAPKEETHGSLPVCRRRDGAS